RQYYSPWYKQPESVYFYRSYYYKPEPKYQGYKHQYVILDPKKPDYCFFYDPYARKYWGRCQVGKPGFSLLPEKDRKATLAEIPDTAYPKAAALPPIPD